MRVTRPSRLAFLCIVAIASSAHAQVILTSNQTENTIEGKFTANQVLPILFALSAEGETGIFGVDFAIDCGDSPIRIRSAAFDSAWPNAVGEQDFALPGQRFRVIRSQPPGNMNRTLGANSQSVPFATVEFEVLSDDGFEAACTIQANASIIGQPDTTTIVLPANPENATGPVRQNTLVFRNTTPSEDTTPKPQPPWTSDSAELTVTFRDTTTGQTAKTLQPSRAYAVSYNSTATAANSFLLFVVGQENPVETAIVPAASGAWNATENFEVTRTSEVSPTPITAVGFGEDYYRLQSVRNDLMFDEKGWTDNRASGTGDLCILAPQSAGTLHLEVYLSFTDVQNRRTVSSEARVSVPVQSQE